MKLKNIIETRIQIDLSGYRNQGDIWFWGSIYGEAYHRSGNKIKSY